MCGNDLSLIHISMKTGIHEVTHAMLHDRDFMEEQGEKKNQMTKEVEAESVASVSYTHLDVYKRQGIWWANRIS